MEKTESKKIPLSIESLDVDITSICNLGCSYCYRNCGSLIKKGDMTNEVIENTLNLIEKFGYPRPIKDERGRTKQPTKISFYGGEPFLSFERVKYFIERSEARGMKLQFSCLSNGTTGTPEIVEYLKARKIWTQRSIDGYPEAQEKYRPNSVKLYNEKTELFKDFDSSRRMTINPEFAKDIMKSWRYFQYLGFNKGISPMPNYYAKWEEQHIQDFENSIWELARDYDKKWESGDAFYVYYFNHDMMNRFMSPTQPRQFGCGGGSGLHCVRWDGEVFLCHRFCDDPLGSEAHYGSLKEILNGTAKGYGENFYYRVWQHRQSEKEWNPECRDCIARYGCEKGCMHSSIKTTGKFNVMPEPYCRIRKAAAKAVVWLDSRKRCKNPDWWTQNNPDSNVQKYIKNKKRNIKNNCKTGQGCGVDMCQEFV